MPALAEAAIGRNGDASLVGSDGFHAKTTTSDKVVEPVSLTGVYKNLPQGIVALVFRCKAVGGELRTTPEAAECRWLTLDEVRELMTEAYGVRLLDAVADGPIGVRSHDGTRLLGSADALR